MVLSLEEQVGLLAAHRQIADLVDDHEPTWAAMARIKEWV